MSLSLEQERALRNFSYKENYYAYLKSDEWRERRDKKLKKVSYCEICGKTIEECKLVVHHKTYINWPFEKMRDLEVLCRDGHDYRHSRRSEPCSNFKPKVILRKKKSI